VIRNRFAALTVTVAASAAAVLCAVPARAAVSRPKLSIHLSAPTMVVDDRTSGHPTTVTYKIDVANVGSRTAHNVSVVDVLPDGLTFDGGFTSTTVVLHNLPAGVHWHGKLIAFLDTSTAHPKLANQALAISTDAYPAYSNTTETRVVAISAATITR
jgi:uncharacterized repeat protein (TIGR01451 family)